MKTPELICCCNLFIINVDKTIIKTGSIPVRATIDIAEDFNFDQLASQAGLSKFHFHRLFKSAVGMSPSHYHISMRMDGARRLLRETKKGIVEVALDVGCTNPSHFAQVFRRESQAT